MKQFYVYVYRDPSRNNEPIYVGKGFGNRAYRHLKRNDKHPFTQRLQLMKRNGVEPGIQILPCESEELAFLAEEEAVDKFGRKDLGTGTLLNLTNGGEGTSGYIPSPETRKKMSEALSNPSPETRQKLSEVNKGKLRSPETRQLISEASKGKSHGVETRKKISEALKGQLQPKITCPHCGKEGGVSVMKQRHFDNCKFRP